MCVLRRQQPLLEFCHLHNKMDTLLTGELSPIVTVNWYPSEGCQTSQHLCGIKTWPSTPEYSECKRLQDMQFMAHLQNKQFHDIKGIMLPICFLFSGCIIEYNNFTTNSLMPLDWYSDFDSPSAQSAKLTLVVRVLALSEKRNLWGEPTPDGYPPNENLAV